MNSGWIGVALLAALVHQARVADQPEVLAMGTVNRVNVAKKTFEIRNSSKDATQERSSVTIDIESRTPPNTRTDPFGRPNRGPVTFDTDIFRADNEPPDSSPDPRLRAMFTRIRVTANTTFKADDKPIPFSEIKTGDYVVVKGRSKGLEIEASEVTRRPPRGK